MINPWEIVELAPETSPQPNPIIELMDTLRAYTDFVYWAALFGAALILLPILWFAGYD